jgi:hypothetical protein
MALAPSALVVRVSQNLKHPDAFWYLQQAMQLLATTEQWAMTAHNHVLCFDHVLWLMVSCKLICWTGA